jgi:hypothetical protein
MPKDELLAATLRQHVILSIAAPGSRGRGGLTRDAIFKYSTLYFGFKLSAIVVHQ